MNSGNGNSEISSAISSEKPLVLDSGDSAMPPVNQYFREDHYRDEQGRSIVKLTDTQTDVAHYRGRMTIRLEDNNTGIISSELKEFRIDATTVDEAFQRFDDGMNRELEQMKKYLTRQQVPPILNGRGLPARKSGH